MFSNLLRKGPTAAEILRKTREVVSKYDIAEVYYKYDDMKDPETDRPEWIRLTYTGAPGFTIRESMALCEELDEVVGDRVGPFNAFKGDWNLTFAREHYVPLFS